MPIERLTAEDLAMLGPDEAWPQDIGALGLLDGTSLLDERGRFRLEAVRDAIAARLHLVPRFRQVLRVPPSRLGGPFWLDAPAFDLDQHIGVVPLEAPATEAQLLAEVERLRSRRLDPSRPLWEMWFLTGLPESRVGWFVRLHHTIGDGIAGTATIAALLDPTANPVGAPAAPWAVAPPPTEEELLRDRRRRRRAAVRRALSSIVHIPALARDALAAWPSMRELLVEGTVVPTSLDRLVGPGRTIALVRSRLGVMKGIARVHGATVNDVLLAVTAGGIRRLLLARREPVDGLVLRVYVPVSLRHGAYAGARGNRISQMVVPLPIGESDPARRLASIAAETARRKELRRPSLGFLPTGGLAGRVFLKLLRRHRVNVTTANIPGPDRPLYLAGAQLLEVFPLVNLVGWVSLGVAGMSYAGQFDFMLLGDRDGYPDVEVLAAGMRDELALLGTGQPMPVKSERPSPRLAIEAPLAPALHGEDC